MSSLQALVKSLGLDAPEKLKLLDPADQAAWKKAQEAQLNKPRVPTTADTIDRYVTLGEKGEDLRQRQGTYNIEYGRGASDLYGDTRDRDSARRIGETSAGLEAYSDAFNKMQGVPYGVLMREAQQADAVGLDKLIDYYKVRDSQANTQNMIANLLRGAGTIGVLLS
jgi:hypothetical protein